ALPILEQPFRTKNTSSKGIGRAPLEQHGTHHPAGPGCHMGNKYKQQHDQQTAGGSYHNVHRASKSHAKTDGTHPAVFSRKYSSANDRTNARTYSTCRI